jgi:hypothetical protein
MHCDHGRNLTFLKEPNCWGESVLEIAELERDCLVRAGKAAAMAAIGRGVYAALVESLREKDGSSTTRFHRDALTRAIPEHRNQALGLNIDVLASEVIGLRTKTLEVLRATQAWLAKACQDLEELAKVYEDAEYDRKQERARLKTTRNGRTRRDEWNVEKVASRGQERAETEPLHYRWDVVCGLLNDLNGAAHGD